MYTGELPLLSAGKWINAYEMPDSFKTMATGRLLGFSNLIAIAIVYPFLFLSNIPEPEEKSTQ